MASREVKVTINGEEHVSEAAAQAEGGLTGLINKVPGWAVAAGALAGAFEAIKTAVGAVKDYVVESFAAFDTFAASNRKLEAQSKLTGVSLTELRAIAERARTEFGLNATVANDLATTVAKYASRAGDATQANKLMAAALDLGAASGLTAAESMEALEQGLRGQDEGFDKLLGKNPSTLWKEYADANGLAVGKMTDTQKRMAELTAVVEAGNVVVGSYADRIGTGAGQTEQLNNKLDMAKAQFGEALQPVRILVVQGLSVLLETLTPLLVMLGRVANFIGEVFVGSFQLARSAVGGVVEGIGKLTGNTALEEWGKKQAAAFPEFVKQLQDMEGAHNKVSDAATNSGKAHKLAAIEIKASVNDTAAATKKAKDEEKAYWASYEAALKTVMAQLKEETRLYILRLKELNPAAKEAFDTIQADAFNKSLQDVKKAADDAFAAIKQHNTLPPLTSQHHAALQLTGDKLATAARATLDWGDTFGILDDKTKNALNSVINLAAALPKALAGDFTSIAGVIGAVGSLVQGVTAGDAERRALLKDNTRALDKLREDGVSLSNKASGETIAKAKELFAPGFAESLAAIAATPNHGDVRAMDALNAALAKMGLRVSDLDKLAQDVGVGIRDKNGNISFDALVSLVRGINTPGFGTSIGQSFSDQLQFFRDSQTLSGASGATKVKDLLAYLRDVGGVSALNGLDFSDPTKLASSLFNLRASLNNPGFDPAKLGKLTGTQFSDLLLELIPQLQSGDVTSGVGAPSTGDTVNVPGLGSVPSSAADALTTAITAQTDALAVYHTDSLGFFSRIADATEGSWLELKAIRGILEFFNPSRDRMSAIIDSQLETTRQSLATTMGIGGSF